MYSTEYSCISSSFLVAARMCCYTVVPLSYSLLRENECSQGPIKEKNKKCPSCYPIHSGCSPKSIQFILSQRQIARRSLFVRVGVKNYHYLALCVCSAEISLTLAIAGVIPFYFEPNVDF
jgi:hypothetical protein